MSINVTVNPLNQSEQSYIYLTPEQAKQLGQWLLNWKPGEPPVNVPAISGDIQVDIEPVKG